MRDNKSSFTRGSSQSQMFRCTFTLPCRFARVTAAGILDAHRDDGKRLVVRAGEKLTAFVELELAVEPFSASFFL